jgi:hypothetical protein
MFENVWNTWNAWPPTVTTYLVGNCGGAGVPFLPTSRGGWEHRRRPPLVPLSRQARWMRARARTSNGVRARCGARGATTRVMWAGARRTDARSVSLSLIIVTILFIIRVRINNFIHPYPLRPRINTHQHFEGPINLNLDKIYTRKY